MSRPLRAAILTVSDTCSKDSTQDKSGPAVAALFEHASIAWDVAATAICEDSVVAIQKIIKAWVDDNTFNVIVTIGGTGFAKRDVTPEAVRPLLDKEAPGLVHAMLKKSMEITPLAAMSRPVAGVAKSTLIFTVPGSVKGAIENTEAIISLLPHACDLANGSVDSRQIHAKGTEQIEIASGLTSSNTNHSHSHSHSHSHCHHHHHQSNDPKQSVARRARSSPYPMIAFEDALALIKRNVPQPKSIVLPISDANQPLTDFVVSEDIYAKESVPAYRASIVDGYAVIASDGPGTYSVVSISHASESDPNALPALSSGQITRITTGAPLPAGADSVVMVEDTELMSSTEDGSEEKTIKILVQAKKNDNIREIGSDMRKDALVMARGERITGVGGEIGVLAGSGIHHVPVYRKPIVGVLSTGDELVDPSVSRPLVGGEIRDTNRLSLLSRLQTWNFPALDLGIAKDVPETLESVLSNALARCDVVVTTGGVSMGERDLLKPTIERSLQGTIQFGRVALKPGKPTTFATLEEKAIFGLPGNPASAIVTFHLFVLPYLRQFAGYAQPQLPRVKVSLSSTVTLDPRPEFHRVMVSVTPDGKLIAESTGGQRSSRVASLRCNALLCLPQSSTTQTSIPAGQSIDAIIIDELRAS